MEMDELIRQITESVIARLNEKQEAVPKTVPAERAITPVITTSGEEPARIFDYTRMSTSLTLNDAKAAALTAKSKAYRSICIPQWLVSSVAGTLNGDTLLTTIIGLPGGSAMTQTKYAETKIAIQNGVDGVLIPMNMDLLASGKRDAVKLDFASAAAPADGAGSLVIALVEIGGIPEDRVFEALAIAESAKADEVRLSCIKSGKPADPGEIARYVRKSGIPVSVVGGITREAFAGIAACGVCGIGASFEL